MNFHYLKYGQIWQVLFLLRAVQFLGQRRMKFNFLPHSDGSLAEL